MAISIRLIEPRERAAPALGPWTFKDHRADILIGRDPEACQVLFPSGEVQVGKRHLALREQLGRYRLLLNEENVVLLDGEQALDGQEIPSHGATLQLGTEHDAPKLRVEPAAIAPGLLSTVEHEGKITQRGLVAGLGRRVMTLGALAFALAAAALAIGEYTRKRVNVTVVSLEELSRQSGVSLAALERRAIASDPERLAKVAEAARPSVLLVLAMDQEGLETPIGTAWVAAPGKLATNAHVAEVQLDDPKIQLWVRSVLPPFRTWAVSAVQVHPGHNDFNTLLADYEPFKMALGHQLESREFISVCDVALLEVDDPSELPPPLPIAEDGRLASLRAGDELVMVGFPMEGIAGGGTNTDAPTATVQTGRITALTDPFLGKPKKMSGEIRDDAVLLQHSTPATGGASGSPLLDREGFVVGILSGGNVLFLFGGMRVPSAAMINYAQRVDLLSELSSAPEDLVSVQQRRLAQWKSDLKQFESAGSSEGRRKLILAEVEGEVTELETKHVVLDQLLPEGFAAEDADHGTLFRLTLPEDRSYLAIALAPDDSDPNEPGEQRSDVQLLALSRADGELLVDESSDQSWWRAGMFTVETGKREVDVVLRGRSGTAVEFWLYEFIETPEEEDILIKAILEAE